MLADALSSPTTVNITNQHPPIRKPPTPLIPSLLVGLVLLVILTLGYLTILGLFFL